MTIYDTYKCPKPVHTSMSNKGFRLQKLGILEGDQFKPTDIMESI